MIVNAMHTLNHNYHNVSQRSDIIENYNNNNEGFCSCLFNFPVFHFSCLFSFSNTYSSFFLLCASVVWGQVPGSGDWRAAAKEASCCGRLPRQSQEGWATTASTGFKLCLLIECLVSRFLKVKKLAWKIELQLIIILFINFSDYSVSNCLCHALHVSCCSASVKCQLFITVDI